MTYLLQGDQRWSSVLLGNGPRRIGQSGCVLVALTIAARWLGTRPALLPPHANVDALGAKAFDGSLLRVHDAAPSIGLSAPLSERLVLGENGCTPDDLRACLERTLRDGDCALVRVDHTGDEIGDHTVLAFAFDDLEQPKVIQCADPATGAMSLDWPDLVRVGLRWGKSMTKTYRVTGVRPIHRMPQ